MANNKVVKNVLKQKLGNENIESNFGLHCIFCGNDRGIIEIAHRDDYKHITGYIIMCKKCFKIIDLDKLSIKILSNTGGQ